MDNIVHRANIANAYYNNIISNTNNLSNLSNIGNMSTQNNMGGTNKISFSGIGNPSGNKNNAYQNGKIRLYTVTKTGLKPRDKTSKSKNKQKNLLLEKFSI